MFTERLAAEAGRLGLRTIEVGVTTTEDALVNRVADTLGI